MENYNNSNQSNNSDLYNPAALQGKSNKKIWFLILITLIGVIIFLLIYTPFKNVSINEFFQGTNSELKENNEGGRYSKFTLEERCDWNEGSIEIINFDDKLKKEINLYEESKIACCYKIFFSEDNFNKYCFWFDDEEFRYTINYNSKNDTLIYFGYTLIPKTTKILGKKSLDKIISYSYETGILSFSETTPELKSISIGDILVMGITEHTPYSALKEVNKIDIQENGIVFS